MNRLKRISILICVVVWVACDSKPKKQPKTITEKDTIAIQPTPAAPKTGEEFIFDSRGQRLPVLGRMKDYLQARIAQASISCNNCKDVLHQAAVRANRITYVLITQAKAREEMIYFSTNSGADFSCILTYSDKLFQDSFESMQFYELENDKLVNKTEKYYPQNTLKQAVTQAYKAHPKYSNHAKLIMEYEEVNTIRVTLLTPEAVPLGTLQFDESQHKFNFIKTN